MSTGADGGALLLEGRRVEVPVEEYLGSLGEVFVEHRGHDSHNVSFGVQIGSERWFVKFTDRTDAVPHLESTIRFHEMVQHPAVIPLRNWFRTPTGLAIVHNWCEAEVLNDPLAPGSRPREHPDSAWSRFRRLPLDEVLTAIDTILDAHLSVARQGFVAVDFYDGSIMYNFDARSVHLCDLDSYRRGPYTLDRDRQFGSTRFMAPEESVRGATIDERTTVYTLGRTVFVFLSRETHGEPGRQHWPASDALFRVAERATAIAPTDRYQTVDQLTAAWRAAT